MLSLEMSMHQSDRSKNVAELIFWYWNDKEIAILQVGIKNANSNIKII
jgi:hypothetical protein